MYRELISGTVVSPSLLISLWYIWKASNSFCCKCIQRRVSCKTSTFNSKQSSLPHSPTHTILFFHPIIQEDRWNFKYLPLPPPLIIPRKCLVQLLLTSWPYSYSPLKFYKEMNTVDLLKTKSGNPSKTFIISSRGWMSSSVP